MGRRFETCRPLVYARVHGRRGPRTNWGVATLVPRTGREKENLGGLFISGSKDDDEADDEDDEDDFGGFPTPGQASKALQASWKIQDKPNINQLGKSSLT